jgi:hypothetical protein
VVIHLVNHLNDKKPVGPLVSLKPSKQQQICGEPLKKKKIKWIPWKKLHTNQTKNVLILGVADLTLAPFYLGNKGNNKITELRTILQRES